jgi:DNA-binding MarR family transcriptional regulator
MGDRVKTVKKMESFATEAFEEEKKAKQKDMEAVFYTSGVDARTSEEFLDYQAQKKEYQENRKPVHNHLQRDLVLIVSELVKKGIDLKNAKDALVKRGFKRSDISVAISNLDYDLYLKAQQNGYTNQGPKDLLKFLTKEQMDFLEQVAQRSYTVSELYRTLQVSGRKGNELKQSLERLELIDAIEDRTGKGMRKKIYLTPKGTELLENAGIAMY